STAPSIALPSSPARPSLPCFVFFLMIRPPPTSPLFPYTTLFRSLHVLPVDLLGRRGPGGRARCGGGGRGRVGGARATRPRERERSEEHTSELQSLTNLVCRLLLEKKKTAEQDRDSRGTGRRGRTQ